MTITRLFDTPAPAVTLPETGYLRLSEVLRVIPVSKSTWYLGIKAGHYPAPIKLSTRRSGWDVADIRACIARIKTQSIGQ